MNWMNRLFGDGSEADSLQGSLLGSQPQDRGARLPAGLFDGEGSLAHELERSRRYEHAMSVVVLRTHALDERDGATNADAQTVETRMPHVVSLLAATALRELLRESDVMCYRSTTNRFVIALAESDGGDAEQAVERIGRVFRDELQLGMRAGISRFPDDGLTLDDLVSEAEARCSGAEAPTPVSPAGRDRLAHPGRNGNGAGTSADGQVPSAVDNSAPPEGELPAPIAARASAGD